MIDVDKQSDGLLGKELNARLSHIRIQTPFSTTARIFVSESRLRGASTTDSLKPSESIRGFRVTCR